VNLSESVEATFLTDPLRSPFRWNPATREMYMDKNYIEFAHSLAGVPHVPAIKFYPTDAEKFWAKKQKDLIGGRVIVWSLKGSSPHKWYDVDLVMDKLLAIDPDVNVLLMGGPECIEMEKKYDLNPRVIRTVGKWPIRNSLAFAQVADLVIGPETGVLNAVSCEPMPKVVFLSHSTLENFSRDWVNTTSIWSKDTTCPGRGHNEAAACHMLHQKWDTCQQDPVTKMSQCMSDLDPDEIVEAVRAAINRT
jgi:ADP-heptose:LPS heptosyltransferase